MTTEGTFTVWVCESDRTGTTYVAYYTADTAAEAADLALDDCAAEWTGDVDSGEKWVEQRSMLRVLGIANGAVELVEWNDGD